MFVWVMNGLLTLCCVTISRWKVPPGATLETLRGATRFENLTAIASVLGKILLCHTKMMDCHCFLVLLYAGLGHEWALAMVLRDNFTLEGVLACHS